VAAAIAYVAAVHWSYVTIISPLFAYNGALYQPASDGSLPFALFVAVLPAVWLPIAVSRPSQVAQWVLFVLGYVPTILFPYYVLGTGFEGILPFTLAVAGSFALLSAISGIRLGGTSRPTIPMRTFENMAIGLALLLAAYIILAFGFSFSLPSLGNVYDVRSSFDQAVINASLPFVAYIVDWSLYVASPLLMLLGLRSHRYGMLAGGLALELLVYSTTGYKSAVLSFLLVVPLLVLLARRFRGAFGVSLPAAGAILVLGSVAWDQISGTILASFLFIHRAIALPGQLVADYYDFFSNHRQFELTQSIFAFLGPTPFDLPPPRLIGAVYFNAPSEDANANLWADAFANFGLVGVIAFTITLGLVLIFLDNAATGRDLRVTGPIAGLMAIVLSNSALLTTILTHGLAFAIVLFYFMPQEAEPAPQFQAGMAGLQPVDSS
jgi:hypothetical protein